MIPENKKREMRFSVLSLLKENGMPSRQDEEGEETPELLALTDAEETDEEKAERLKKEAEALKKKAAEKKKSGSPSLSPSGVEAMKGAFKKQM